MVLSLFNIYQVVCFFSDLSKRQKVSCLRGKWLCLFNLCENSDVWFWRLLINLCSSLCFSSMQLSFEGNGASFISASSLVMDSWTNKSCQSSKTPLVLNKTKQVINNAYLHSTRSAPLALSLSLSHHNIKWVSIVMQLKRHTIFAM